MPNRNATIVQILVGKPTERFTDFGGITLLFKTAERQCFAKLAKQYACYGDENSYAKAAATAAVKYGTTQHFNTMSSDEVTVEFKWFCKGEHKQDAADMEWVPSPNISARRCWQNSLLKKVLNAIEKTEMSAFRQGDDGPLVMLKGIEDILRRLRATPAVYDRDTHEFHEVPMADAIETAREEMLACGMIFTPTDSEESAA